MKQKTRFEKIVIDNLDYFMDGMDLFNVIFVTIIAFPFWFPIFVYKNIKKWLKK